MIPAFDAHVIGGILIGKSLGDSAAKLSPTYRPIATKLDAIEQPLRLAAFQESISGRPDADELVRIISNLDPEGPLPPIEVRKVSYATLEDLEKVVAGQAWAWKGYLASGVLNVIAAEPGTGKTRLGMDLARRLYHGLPWPDGQSNEYPPGSRTLWIEADRSFR